MVDQLNFTPVQDENMSMQPGTQPAPPIPPMQSGTQSTPPMQPGTQSTPPAMNAPLISFNTTGPEPVQDNQLNVYESIIEQQKAQIDALMQQNNALNGQITQMVQNGVQITQPTQQLQQQVNQSSSYQPQEFAPVYAGERLAQPALSDDADYSLEGLADQIGKKPTT